MPANSMNPIRTEEDYNAAIEEIAALWNAEPGTPQHDRLEVLGVLIDAYESAQRPIGRPDPDDNLEPPHHGGVSDQVAQIPPAGMRQPKMTESLKRLKADLLRDKAVRRAYEDMAPEFEVARAVIKART